MEQEAKQHPYIGHIACSMQRMAYEYAKQIITSRIDVKSITVGSANSKRPKYNQESSNFAYFQMTVNGKIRNTMKRLIRWIINWLYAEEIAALVQEAVDDEFEATWPEAFRHQPEHNSVIPQEIWAVVILNLPNHAEIIHGQWMDNTNHIHILTRTVKLANTTYIREFQLTMDAYRLRLDHTHSRDEIFCGRYAHLLQVQIWLPGNYNSPKADYVLEFSLMQYRLTGPGVEGAVPYWRCNTKPDIVHAFTSETLAGIERGLKHFKK